VVRRIAVLMIVEANTGHYPRADIRAARSFAATVKLKTDFEIFVLHTACQASKEKRSLLRSLLPIVHSMKSPKRKRISDIEAGVLIVDKIKSAIAKGTAVRFDLSKGKRIK
jgi:hypothetical protein